MNCSDGVLDDTVAQRFQHDPTPVMFIASSTNAFKTWNLQDVSFKQPHTGAASWCGLQPWLGRRDRGHVPCLLRSQIPLARHRITTERGAQL